MLYLIIVLETREMAFGIVRPAKQIDLEHGRPCDFRHAAASCFTLDPRPG